MNEIQKNIEDFVSRVEAELENFVRRVLLKIQSDAVKLLRDNKKVGYTHQLITNIRYEVIKQAGAILGIVGVGSNVPYGIFVHEGTKPHFPPIEPILKWVVFKGLLKNNKKGGSTLRSIKSTLKENEARNIAYLIARKISRTGTQAFPFLKMALNMNLDFIAAEVTKIKIA